MKRTAPMVVVVLALSTMSLAHSSIDFTNGGGALTGSSAGLRLGGSQLVVVQGPHGEEILNNGGTFVITGDGQRGIRNGTIFHASFVGPVAGRWHNGEIVTAKIEELTVKAGSFGGSIGLLSGEAQTQCKTVVPEQGTLALLGIGLGLVGLAGVVRLKAKA
jgi:hypothetical protein